MGAKDYYLVLGVSRTETAAGIRTAYRELARRFHSGPESEPDARAFREMNEAYEALSDPQRRRDHNQHLRQTEEQSPRPRAPRVVREAEPALAEPAWSPISVLADPPTVHPSFEALQERLARNFSGVGVPKSERAEGLNMQILLTPEEAATGLVVAIEVPAVHRCPECQGSGIDWAFPCAYCSQLGVVEEEETVRVRIPPRVRPGTVVEMPLEEMGIRNLVLRLHISVTESAVLHSGW
jgi:DnaJ-class molecular chaperone